MIKNKKDILKETEEFEENKDFFEPASDQQQDAAVEDEKKTEAGENTQKDESQGKGTAESELEKKVKEIEVLTDTMKRRQADFENYKKRMIKTQEEQRKFAIKDMALDIININDDLLRAREAACNVNTNEGQTVKEVCDTFADGFSMISKSIEELLKKYGIEEIDSLNKIFDPNFNEAVEIEESGDVEDEMITRVYQKGFRLDEYLVRAAKVKVSKPMKKPIGDADQAGNEASDG